MSQLPTVLVIGCGSIGERHLRTFKTTGRCRVVACDNRAPILEKMAATYDVATSADWQAALPRVDAVVVATPAPSHVPIATEVLRAGKHCLIEKPLALALDGIDELRATRDASGRACHVAYVHHSRPEARAVKAFLDRNEFGAVCAASIVTGQHFPTFRPAYREIYYRDHAQGGGAIQDGLTHMVNLVEWLLGPTASLFCDAGHQVLDGVEVEDTVAIVSRNRAGAIVTYTLNQFQAPNECTLRFSTGRGDVIIEYHHHRWGRQALGESAWIWETCTPLDRDGPFVIQAHDFLDACDGKPTPMATLEEGIQAVQFNLAAFASWRSGRRVAIA